MTIPEQVFREIHGDVSSGGTVLDIGCHRGDLLARLDAARPDLRLAGIDLDADAVARARAVLPDADLRVGSVATLPFADEAFDLVTCMDVIEHLPEAIRHPMLSQSRRVLKPGGRLIIETPHAGTFAVLDAQNLRHRFPMLYSRLLRRGVRDRAYAGQQDVVWHKHFAREELLELTGAGWKLEAERYPGLLVWPLADLFAWPFHRTGRTDHPIARWLRRANEWDARRDYGPKRGYEVLLTLRRD